MIKMYYPNELGLRCNNRKKFHKLEQSYQLAIKMVIFNVYHTLNFKKIIVNLCLTCINIQLYQLSLILRFIFVPF